MAGAENDVAALMKPHAPLSLYVHCHGHRLNLALQDSMASNKYMKQALGTLQCLFNFIEASPKRHAVFQKLLEANNQEVITLKTLSKTWGKSVK